MAKGVELGLGYLTLAVEASGITKEITQQLAQGQKIASSAGKSMGKAIVDGVNGQKPDLTALTAAVEQAEKKVEAARDRSARSQQESLNRVEKAQRDVEKAVRDHELASEKLSQAEADLKRKQEDSASTAKQLEDAQLRVKKAKNDVADKSDKIADAEYRVKDAQEKSKIATRNAEEQLEKYNAELQEAKGKLSQAEGAMREAENQADKSARGIRGAFQKAFDKVGDKLNFKKAFSGADDEAQKAGKRAGSSFSSSFKGGIAAIGTYFGAAEIFGGIKDSVNSAGDLEQSIGAVDTVFKGSSDQMHQWAKDAATSVGLSENEYNEFASVLGASLKNAGTPIDQLGGKTNDLITLGADLASMYGGTTAEAIDAVSSALRGEMDPIERYGISLNESALEAEALRLGIEKSGGAFTNQQKQLLVQSLLFKQSADAQGNFTKETDTYAGKAAVARAQLENLKTSLGESLLPIMTKVMGFVSEKAIPAFEGFRDAVAPVFNFIKDTAPIWGPFAAGVAIVAGAFGIYAGVMALASAMSTAYAVATGAAAGSTTLLSGALAILLSPITWIIVSIGLLVGAVIYAYNNFEWFRNGVNAVWEWIKNVIAGFVTWWTETAWPTILYGLDWLGQKFVWLYESVILPVWGWITGVIQGFLDWWTATLVPAFQTAIDILGQIFSWLYNNVILPVWTGIKTYIALQVAALMTIWNGIVWVFQNVLGPIFIWLYENVVKPVFDWIVARIDSFVTWFRDTAVPFVQAALAVARDAFQWLGQKVSDVWHWIATRISDAWSWVRVNVLDPLISFLKVYVGGAFQWLGQKVSDVWHWIATRISNAWSWTKNTVLNPLIDFVKNTLGGAWSWLRDHTGAIWDAMSGKIRDSWAWIKDKVLNPMGDFLQHNVVDFFRRTKDGIKNIWDGIKSVVKKPVEFVVNTVIRDGLIGNYNKIADTFGVGKIDTNKIKLPDGWATGGYTGRGRKYEPAGVVHRDEYVIRKESTNRIRKEYGLSALDYLNKTGDLSGALRLGKAARDHRDSHKGLPAGPGTRVYNGFSFSNPLQRQIAQMGQLSVSNGGVSSKWSISSAAAAWNGMSGVKLTGQRQSGVPHLKAIPAHGQWWAGYYNGGNDIQLNEDQGFASNKSYRLVSIHEIGHALGLPHSMGFGQKSIMDYGTMYNLAGPSNADAKALQAIYPGGSGKGYSGDGSEGLLNPLAFLMDELKKKFTEKFPGTSAAIDLAWGFGKKLIQAAIDFVNPFSDGGGDSASEGQVREWMTRALKMKGLYSDANLASGVRRAMQESGGDTRAMNGWDINALMGNPSKGLMQVIDPTFKAYMEPGHGDIWNPLDNILASINYTLARYGSLRAGWDRAGGYAMGGLVKPKLYDKGGLIQGKGLRVIDHQRSTPDYVLTERQWEAMYKTAEAVQRNSNGTEINITVPEREGVDPTTMGRRMGDALAFNLAKAGIR